MAHSINTIAAVFGVDRASAYAWIRRGCPRVAAEGPGKPANMHFAKVLAWRRTQLKERGYSDGYIELAEQQARTRLKAFTKAQR